MATKIQEKDMISEEKKAIVQVDNVYKSFRKTKAVLGVSFNVYPGEYIAILGPNGAGKTTMVEMIEGIQRPDKGNIFVNQMRWSKNKKDISRILGISLQETRFFERLQCIEVLDLFGSFYGLKREDNSQMLRRLGLGGKKSAFVKTLSGGEKQKLALAVALIHEPKILILDEPTTGLDPNSRKEIWKILLSLKYKNTTLILTTHYMEEAEKLCDRILIMYSGKILAQGSLDELLQKHAPGEFIEIKTSEEPAFLNKIKGIKKAVWDAKQNKMNLIVSHINQTLPAISKEMNRSKLDILEIDCRRMTLDSLFTHMTGEKLDE